MKSSKKPHLKGIKKTFLKLGTCSRTLNYILNREFENPMEQEEKALDPLAGGILQQGYQCGMLWGSSMAVGTEAYRRPDVKGSAIALAIKATQNIMGSFAMRTGSHDCFDITECDFKKKKNLFKFLFSGKAFSCFRLAERWAPEAIEAAQEGLKTEDNELPEKCMSCASEVVKKMGGSEKEVHMVAGFAGGLGLSGNACGALGASIWMNSLIKEREGSGKISFSDQGEMEQFYKITDYEILCRNITGQSFESVEEHTAFLEKGGCKELIEKLAG